MSTRVVPAPLLIELARSIGRELALLSCLRFAWLCAFPLAFYWLERQAWSAAPIVLGFALDGAGQVLSQRLRRSVRARCFERSALQALDKETPVPRAQVESAFWAAHLTEFAVTVDLPAIVAGSAALLTVGVLSFLRMGAAFVLPAAGLFLLLAGLTFYANRVRAPLLHDIVSRRLTAANFLGAAERDAGEITGQLARGHYHRALGAFVTYWSGSEDRFERIHFVHRAVIGGVALAAFFWLATRYGLDALTLRDGSNLLLMGSALPIARGLAINVDSLLISYATLIKLELPSVRHRRRTARLTTPPKRLLISSLTHAYDSRIVLDIAHLQLDLSRPLLIAGENGAGKTTLVALVSGALNAGKASIQLDNVDAREVSGDDMAVVPQHPVMLPELSIADNVALISPNVATNELEAALRELGLWRPGSHGMGELSRGEQQRVAIARALLKRPKLLILDEPDAWLDQAGRHALGRTLERCSPDVAIIVVTHRPELHAIGGQLLTLKADHSFALTESAPETVAGGDDAGTKIA